MHAAVAAKWMGLPVAGTCDEAVERPGHFDDKQSKRSWEMPDPLKTAAALNPALVDLHPLIGR
jgi:hypothetical protein